MPVCEGFHVFFCFFFNFAHWSGWSELEAKAFWSQQENNKQQNWFVDTKISSLLIYSANWGEKKTRKQNKTKKKPQNAHKAKSDFSRVRCSNFLFCTHILGARAVCRVRPHVWLWQQRGADAEANARQTKGLPSVCAFAEHLGKQMGLTHKAQYSHEECIKPRRQA